MSQLSYMNIDQACLYIDNTSPTYFGIQKGCLDMQSMRYKIFGAVWKLVDDNKCILGYWFADHEREILCSINDAGFTSPIKSEIAEINDIYQFVRAEQDQENWAKRSRLRFLSILKKPLKNLSKGWYVLTSSHNFPCILTCIQKKRFSIWIEHIQVCENKNDAVKFINLINAEHNIHLDSTKISEIENKFQ